MKELLTELTPVFVTLMSTLAAILVKTLNDYVKAKYADTSFSNITEKLNEVVSTVVLKIEQTHVDALKMARLETSPGGARITPEEAKEIAAIAFDTTMIFLGQKGIDELKLVYNFDTETVSEFIRHKIEAAVLTIHQQKTVITSLESTPAPVQLDSTAH